MPIVVAYPAFKNRAPNPYQSLLYDELSKSGWHIYDLDHAIRYLGRADILHLHWPDGFINKPHLLQSLSRSLLLLALITAYRLSGAKIVWTIHNFSSHSQYHPRLEKWFWRKFYRKIDAWIALNKHTVEEASKIALLRNLPHTIIRHGLYPAPLTPKTSPKSGKHLLCVGQIRANKQIPLLLEAFEKLSDPEITLTIAGRCTEQTLETSLKQKQHISGLTLDLRHLDETALAQQLQQAHALIIPYAETLNSGVVYLALGANKPVIAPDNPVNRELATDFGHHRIILYETPLSSDTLRTALKKLDTATPAENSPPPEHNTIAYQWTEIAARHDKFFSKLKQ